MNRQFKIEILFVCMCGMFVPVAAQGIYHKGWIDFNKNGKMDVYENPQATIEDRE